MLRRDKRVTNPHFWDENEYTPWTPKWILKEALLCLAERRLPKRLLVRRMVSPWWFYRLKLTHAVSKKLKVGFGPVVEGQYNIGVRGSRIDPIVDCLNRTSETYSADIFFDFEEMNQFDVLVIVKEFHAGLNPLIRDLKKQGKLFFFDIVDNPFCTDPHSQSYHENPEFLALMHGIIASSPIQINDVRPVNPNVVLIEHPIINFEYSSYPSKNSIDILWQGYFANAEWMFRLHDIVRQVRKDTRRDVTLIYHSNHPTQDDGEIKYIKWKIREWQRMLAQCDIGIVIKPPEDDIQRRKPSNKVLSYMAAGLPVVCTPTEADKLIMVHGQHGFFAYTDEEWYSYLTRLAEDAELRKTMGTAARNFVWQHFTIHNITQKYITVFDQVG